MSPKVMINFYSNGFIVSGDFLILLRKAHISLSSLVFNIYKISQTGYSADLLDYSTSTVKTSLSIISRTFQRVSHTYTNLTGNPRKETGYCPGI